MRQNGDTRVEEHTMTTELMLPDILLNLKHIEIFEKLSPQDLAAIASATQESHFDEKQVVIREGEPGQLQRGSTALDEQIGNWTRIGIRPSEIQCCDTNHIALILNQQRKIQARVVTKHCQGLLLRARAENDPGWIAGQQVGHYEYDRDDGPDQQECV